MDGLASKKLLNGTVFIIVGAANTAAPKMVGKASPLIISIKALTCPSFKDHLFFVMI